MLVKLARITQYWLINNYKILHSDPPNNCDTTFKTSLLDFSEN